MPSDAAARSNPAHVSALRTGLRASPADTLERGVTVADAAALTGLSLFDVERALHALSAAYGGHLSVTDKGELLFRFARGLDKPLDEKPWYKRAWDGAVRLVKGGTRFVLRAWISVVMIGYAVGFVAILLALMFGGRDDDRGPSVSPTTLYVVMRLISEALFWTFHPFSPVAVRPGQRRNKRRKKDGPDVAAFYERVNRFVFGPSQKPISPEEVQKAVIALIRAKSGRVGLFDVMRVTGLSKAEADPLLSRLVLDYDGEIDVSEDGAVTYRFEQLRKSTQGAPRAPQPMWRRLLKKPVITGNTTGQNMAIAALNGFNLLASMFAINAGLTLERLGHLIDRVPFELMPPADGPALLLGWIPLVFSLGIFTAPLLRVFTKAQKEREVTLENGRRGVLHELLENMKPGGVSERDLKRAFAEAAGREPTDRELTKAVVALGGDVELDPAPDTGLNTEATSADGGAQYRFIDLEAEVAALEAARARAHKSEAEVGQVVFASDA